MITVVACKRIHSLSDRYTYSSTQNLASQTVHCYYCACRSDFLRVPVVIRDHNRSQEQKVEIGAEVYVALKQCSTNCVLNSHKQTTN